MLAYLRPAAVMLALMTVLTGLVYPLVMTGVAQMLLPDQANGSPVMRGETVAGSALIGQSFAGEGYFHPRPSASGQNGYDAMASSGSNLGPTSKKLVDRVAADVAALRASGVTVIPADAVTTSASGLDPHVSRATAEMQVARVARARGTDPARLQAILDRVTEWPWLGFIGEPRVNVLRLNLELDTVLGKAAG